MSKTIAEDTFDEQKASNILLGIGALGLGASLLMHFLQRGSLYPSEQARIMAAPKRVVLIGDSLAVGMAGTFSKLSKLGKHAFFASGCGLGSTPSQNCTAIVGASVLPWSSDAWIGHVLKTYKPNVVLISLGTNDFSYGEAGKLKVKEAVRLLVKKIKASGATPVWIEPVSMPFDDTAGVKESWKETGIPFFGSRWLSYKRAPDGIHLTQEGYQDWATKIWTWLLEQ